jgi:hypothetical protein
VGAVPLLLPLLLLLLLPLLPPPLLLLLLLLLHFIFTLTLNPPPTHTLTVPPFQSQVAICFPRSTSALRSV